MNSATPSPAVSVIVPAWNASQTLSETLNSLRGQTFTDYEVIVVDDGSTDQTAEIVRRFCQADSRFILLQQANQGLATTRNVGLARARGEYVTFLDADDVWLPQKIARQLELFQQEPRANLVFTNYFFWDGQADLNVFFRNDRPLPLGPAGRQLILANPFIPSIVMLRRSIFETGARFTPGLYCCEDWDLWLQFLEHGLWAHGTRESLVRYRQWEGNMSKRKLEMCATSLKILATRQSHSQVAEFRPVYRQSVAIARARLELAYARRQLETDPAGVAPLIWRAWRIYPRRLKWLLWFAMVRWPKWLAGKSPREMVYRKLRAKF